MMISVSILDKMQFITMYYVYLLKTKVLFQFGLYIKIHIVVMQIKKSPVTIDI